MAGQQQQQRVRVLEAGFAAKIDALQQGLWDSSTSAVALNKKWQETMAIRAQLMVSAAGGALQAPGAAQEAAESNWKGLLIEVYMKAKKERPVLVYTTVDVPEALKPGHGPYVSQVTCQDFQTIYQGEPAITKKKAEHAAAQQALAHEFRADYAVLNSAGPRPPSSSPPALKPPAMKALKNRPPTALALTGGLVFALPGNAPPSKKRKVADMGLGDSTQNSGNDARSRCQQAVQLLLQRCLTKSDVSFDSAEVEATGQFVSSVSIPAYNPKLSFVGQACATKKLAENAACEALLSSQLSLEIARVTAEHQEKRAAKNAESLAKLKADHKEKKAQKIA